MKFYALLSIMLVLPLVSRAAKREVTTLVCTLDADPGSHVSLSVDESGGTKECVLLGVWGSHQEMTIKSALLPHHSLAQQISAGTVTVSLGNSARPETSEVFDGALFAVTRRGPAKAFLGYVALQRDGTSVLPISCEAK